MDASDRDTGAFGRLTYAIESARMTERFSIDAHGKLYTRRSVMFDRELAPNITIPVRVTDSGGKFALTNVVIQIIDENDNEPRYGCTNYWSLNQRSFETLGVVFVRTYVTLFLGNRSLLF